MEKDKNDILEKSEEMVETVGNKLSWTWGDTVVIAAVAGTCLYLLGAAKGAKSSYNKGFLDGYTQGIRTVGGLVSNLRNKFED